MSSRLSVPYFSAPINILGHPKFTALQVVLKDNAKWLPFYLFAYAANYQADGDFSTYTPGLWVAVFQLNTDPNDSRSQALAESWAKAMKACGWFDDRWQLDGELFGNFNTKLTEEKEANAAQNGFNSAKRWHPEQVEPLALAFFGRFGRWPKGYSQAGGSEASPEASALPNPSDPGGRAGEPPPPEGSKKPALASTGAGRSGITHPTKDFANPGPKTPQTGAGFKGKGGAGEPRSLSSRMWLINEGLKTASGDVRRALLKQRADLTAEMTGIANRPTPTPPAQPKKEPLGQWAAPASPLGIAKGYLADFPDGLLAHHVALLRAAKIPLPPEVESRFPVQPSAPALKPTARAVRPISTPAKVVTKKTTARPARRAAKSLVPA